MNFVVCEKRQGVIDAIGHVLVLGGPGSGKTTLALLKARSLMPRLEAGQKTLFLSFSRAAVQQILTRCKEVLSKPERALIDVRTYHALCWDLLHCHGRLFDGKILRMMTPRQEGVRRTAFDGEWEVERRRLFETDGVVCFDLFAHGAARLLEESRHLRSRIADIYPLMILDEFQDTDDDQWRLVRALAQSTTGVFLADADQRIYDFRPGVRPERLDMLRAALCPAETDLADDNLRSADSDILAYADAVLRGTGPLPQTADVVTNIYRYQNMFDSIVHFSVCAAYGELRRRSVDDPVIAVLAPSNALVADISDILTQPHQFSGRALPPVSHDVVWDAELSASAAMTVAAVLELASMPTNAGRSALLERVAQYWLMKKDWAEQYGARGAASANTRASRFSQAAERVRTGHNLRRGITGDLCDAAAALYPLTGSPVTDWRSARALFRGHADLKDIFTYVRMVRLFRATDILAGALSALWIRQGHYGGAVQAVRRILDQERLAGAEKEPRGCMLMTLHKSKGKEFDGVVVVEGQWGGSFLKEHEAPHFEPSRRLLRVGITRARKLVVLVRPFGATPLVS